MLDQGFVGQDGGQRFPHLNLGIDRLDFFGVFREDFFDLNFEIKRVDGKFQMGQFTVIQ